MSDDGQIVIDHFAQIPGVSDLAGSRIWYDSELPEEVSYDPSDGLAILITFRGGRRPYLDGPPDALAEIAKRRDIEISTRVYGPDRAAIRELCEVIESGYLGAQRYESQIVPGVMWQDQKEPKTGWPYSFAFWTMLIRKP